GDRNLGDRLGDSAAAHHEADSAPAIVARHRVHALPYELNDEDRLSKIGEQFLPASRSGGEVEVAGARARGPTDAARCMSRGGDAELPRRCAFRDPGLKNAVVHKRLPRDADALAVEGTRPK